MTSTGLDVLDRSIQKTNEWLKDLMAEIKGLDRNRAYTGLRAVLHALRDRLTVEEAVQFAAQLPMVLRGAYFEGWTPARVPLRLRTLDDFLERVAESILRVPDMDPELITRAVFRVLDRRMSGGEMSHVGSILPAPLRELWPAEEEESVLEHTRGSEPGRRRARRGQARRAKREIRRILAQARVEGVPSSDLPIVVSRRRLAAGSRRKTPRSAASRPGSRRRRSPRSAA